MNLLTKESSNIIAVEGGILNVNSFVLRTWKILTLTYILGDAKILTKSPQSKTKNFNLAKICK